MFKKISLASTVVMLLLFAASASFAAGQFKPEYKMSTNVSEITPPGKAVAYFAEQVKKRTDGKVNIKIYWNGQLFAGKASNEFMLMKNGVGDFSISTFMNWAPQFPAGNLFLLPWFVSSEPNKYKALDAIENGKTGAELKQRLSKMGVEVIGWGEQGARELTNNVRPVKTPDDLKNMKIRVVGSPLLMDVFKAMGANPVNINWNETVTSLQQNVVDGHENPYSYIISYKVYEFQKYVTEWSYWIDPLVYVANKKVWNSFPADIQKIIAECAVEAGMYNKCLSRLNLDDGTSERWLKAKGLMPADNKTRAVDPRAYLKDHGTAVNVLTPDQIKQFRNKTESVYGKWTKIIGADLIDLVKKDMASVR
ncbi:DctP family TRAP transporter solute-binding subunit [Cloacibacillus sp.]|uniref:DctP family TRAP transporter solute-binding subunit n=1 Tax=Cloacibacillus sp. TaxID=2049023 RepID=UPI0025C5036F|nr:DctP family TRAP transporter solute-binding subunit [Cloacibacillus sp.]MCC8057357.1 DctP family TRAP transporter solute-binding subunit [Cloacibacillus sp.]